MNKKFFKFSTFLLPVCISMLTLSSCDNEKECYDGVIEKGELKEVASFKRTVGGWQGMAVTDSTIIIADNKSIECHGYDGTILCKMPFNGSGYVYSFDIDNDGYWIYYTGSPNKFIHISFSGDTISTANDSITTTNPIGYLGDGKMLVPDIYKYKFTLNVVDADSGKYTPSFDILKESGYDLSDQNGGAYAVTSRISQHRDGKTLFYCYFNSKFVVVEGDSVFRMGEDYRHLPVPKTIMMGHNHRLDPMNCGIEAGCVDSTGIYLVTPKFKSRRWCESGVERYLDVYDPHTFEYKGSWLLPVSRGRYIKSISKCGGRIFILYTSGNEGAEVKTVELNNL
ncbi:MAG: hypothetical protein MJ010_08045 [Paludibacteraceae bacterium]|nr:hypothetical protein [Paludibacteraceae bacterium]